LFEFKNEARMATGRFDRFTTPPLFVERVKVFVHLIAIIFTIYLLKRSGYLTGLGSKQAGVQSGT